MGIFGKKNKRNADKVEIVEVCEEQNNPVLQAYNNDNSLPTEQDYLNYKQDKLQTLNNVIDFGKDTLYTIERISDQRERTEQLRIKTAKDIENINKKWNTANNRINKAFEKDMEELGLVSKAMDAAIEKGNMDAVIAALEKLSDVAKESTSSKLNLNEIKDLYDDDF